MPKLALIYRDAQFGWNNNGYYIGGTLWLANQTGNIFAEAAYYSVFTVSGTTLSWYSPSSQNAQVNVKNMTYYYFVCGATSTGTFSGT